MIKAHNWLHGSKLDRLMTMQVHDELVLEVKESRLEDLVNEVI